MFVPMSAKVRSLTRLSPHLLRVVFGGADLQRCVPADPVYDQRIKLIFGVLPDVDLGEDWYGNFQHIPGAVMRTYTVRWARRLDGELRIAVDFVLHPGASGPASEWAAAAKVGDTVILVGPTGAGQWGVDFLPGYAQRIVLAGDETALPAIASILEGLGPEFKGSAFIEVPTNDDILDEVTHPGFEVQWLPRNGHAHGELVASAVLRSFDPATPAIPTALDFAEETDILMWETPTYSSGGDHISNHPTNHSDHYFWIAGESGMVTGIRRVLVTSYNVPRSQVSFMGYWRRGRAS